MNSLHSGGYGSGKNQALANKINAVGAKSLTLCSDKEKPEMIRLLSREGWYVHRSTKKNKIWSHELIRFENRTIKLAIIWWSALSNRQYLEQFMKNPQWMNKGETGIIHMYLNSLK